MPTAPGHSPRSQPPRRRGSGLLGEIARCPIRTVRDLNELVRLAVRIALSTVVLSLSAFLATVSVWAAYRGLAYLWKHVFGHAW